jgi:hypothetical protein
VVALVTESSTMDLLWKGANYFNWHPWRALGVSLVFWGLLLLSLVLRAWRPHVRTLPLLVAASAWVLFGLLEYGAYRERANIRVDLLFTWPALLLLTLICSGFWLYSLFAVRG